MGIANALQNTAARQELSTTRVDQIQARSLGLVGESKTCWGGSFRTVRSRSTATRNGRISCKVNPKLKIELEGFSD